MFRTTRVETRMLVGSFSSADISKIFYEHALTALFVPANGPHLFT